MKSSAIMEYVANFQFAIGTLLLLPSIASALSAANFRSTPNFFSPQFRHGASSSSASAAARCDRMSCTALFARQRHPTPLRAVAEHTVSTATRSEAQNYTDIPISPDSSSGLTVVAGPGTRITSVSSGVVVEQDFWETKFDQGEFVRAFFPHPEIRKVAGVNTDRPGTGKDEKVIVDYRAVDQDFWETKFDQGEFVRPFPYRENTNFVGANNDCTEKEEKNALDYDAFPDELFHGEDIHVEKDIIVAEVTNESKDNMIEDAEFNLDKSDETERLEESTDKKEGSNRDDLVGDSAIHSVMAKSALLHRARIAGTVKKSSRSSGRSSWAKTHVTKSRRGSGRNQGAGAMVRVFGTVRKAAAAAATQKKKTLERSEAETKPGENAVNMDNLTNKNSLTAANPPKSNWKSAIQSTVADMLQTQDAVIQQPSLGTGAPGCESTTNSPLPPGTARMGLLGEVVQEKLPLIPPFPGKLLVRSNEDIMSPKRQVSVRSSIPHSTDDIHIANLRLSVFSRFDEEQQRIFRSRSVEVLNVRRRRGAVVLVAEEAVVPNKARGEQQHQYHTEMQARITNGHEYGVKNTEPAVPVALRPSARSLSVTPMRGAKITRVSSGVVVDAPSLTVTPIRGAKITSVSSGIAVDPPSLAVNPRGAKIISGVALDNDLEFVTVCTHQDGHTSHATDRGTNNRGLIIGSVECSHQEFQGTMLGNSRPKGSLMYVTEVAVRPDARRCGAGAMLMRGVDKVAALRSVETIYLHVDVANRAACAMYEKCGYCYLDKREPIYAQFTASLNLHDGAMHGRKHYLMCKNRTGKTTWFGEDDLFS